ncbi:MAG: hypothetical protein AAB605_00385 [Patescibacteria group bacterium]
MLRTVALAIQTILDTILPRKERIVRVEDYTPENLPAAPQEHEVHGVQITTLMSYHDQAVEDCIRALKYDRSAHAAQLLADVLAEYLREEIASLRAFSTKHVLLVPVPLHRNRFHERGFNQVGLVLERLPTEFKNGELSTIAFSIIERVRETPPQTRLPRQERLINMKDAFALTDMNAALDSHIILIDDVTTTGATLAEAARPLLNLGASVSLLALAHA